MRGPSLLTFSLISFGAFACAGPPEPTPPANAAEATLSDRLAAMAVRVPLTVAHRGASADYPENTLPAFQAAVDAGADMVELDFRQTADGTLVCMHDETLDRTTDCRARWNKKNVPVSSITWSELRQLDAGGWKHARFADTRIPSLKQALDVIQAGSITMVEHKDGDPERLVALLQRMQLVDDVLVQSFDWQWLERVHQLEPRLTIAALGSKAVTAEALDALPKLGASMVHWSGKSLALSDVQALHQLGYLTCAYTLNSDVELLGAAALGLDLITTDRPARMLSLIAAGRLQRPAPE